MVWFPCREGYTSIFHNVNRINLHRLNVINRFIVDSGLGHFKHLKQHLGILDEIGMVDGDSEGHGDESNGLGHGGFLVRGSIGTSRDLSSL